MDFSIRLTTFAAVLSVGSTGLCSEIGKPQLSHGLKSTTSAQPLLLKSSRQNPKPAFVATVRINSPKRVYSRWFDGYVRDDLRGQLCFKGIQILYPNHPVDWEVPEVILKRDKTQIRVIPRVRGKRLIPPAALNLKPPTEAQFREYEKRLAKLPAPILAVWGLRKPGGPPVRRIVLYANGLVDDPAGKTTWDWSGNRLTIDFPGRKPAIFTVSPDGRTISGRWNDGRKLEGRLLGHANSKTTPVLAAWPIGYVGRRLTSLTLYANGKVGDPKSKTTWSWNDGKLSINDGTGSSFTVKANGRFLTGRWQKRPNVRATLDNPVIAFAPAPKSGIAKSQRYASLDRSTADYCRMLVRAVPKNRLPAEIVVEFFTKQADDSNFRIVPVTETSVEFQIVAPTAAQAEANARGLMQIYDYGTLQPIRRFLDSQVRKATAEHEAYKAELQKARGKLARAKYHVGKSGRILGAYSHVVHKYATLTVVDGKINVRPVKWETNRR